MKAHFVLLSTSETVARKMIRPETPASGEWETECAYLNSRTDPEQL